LELQNGREKKVESCWKCEGPRILMQGKAQKKKKKRLEKAEEGVDFVECMVN